MDLGALLIGISILALCLPYIANPFLKKQPAGKGRMVRDQKANLKAERQAVLAALRDLEFDFKTGKVVEEDYATLRSQLIVEAASLIPPDEPKNEDLETLIQARREKLAEGKLCQQCGSRLGTRDLYCFTCGAPAIDPRCSACGQDLAPDARFCSHCGASIQIENK